MSKITPYNSTDSKKIQVVKMFDNIAKRYDLLNHSLSFGLDYYWRKKSIKYLTNKPKKILDVATGTADFAISASKLKDVKIIGIDISKKMINVGQQKIKKTALKVLYVMNSKWSLGFKRFLCCCSIFYSF